MWSTTILVSALCAAAALAAPTYPHLNVDAATPSSTDDLSDYFNTLANKLSSSKQMSELPVCDLSKAVLPTTCKYPPASPQGELSCRLIDKSIAAPSLPDVSEGLTLKHVAIGRGTQNYTCDLSNATAVPSAVGAVATLFNASCVAATYPDLLNMLPRVALAFNLTTSESNTYADNLVPASTNERLAPGNYMISGHHYFLNTKTPFFNLDTTNGQLGEVPAGKNASVAAPADAVKGQGGEDAVAWLKLTAKEGATGRIQEVYRVETAGGSPPTTCTGMAAAFEVQYSAQYVFSFFLSLSLPSPCWLHASSKT